MSNVEDVAGRQQAPVGIYQAKIVKCDGPKPSSNGNPMLEVQFHLTHDAAGQKLKEEFGDIWEYPILEHDHPFVKARFKEFINAVGLKPKGTLDTDKIVGTSLQVKLKTDTDQDGDYRPRIGKMMALAEPEPEPEDEDEDEDEEEEEDEGLDLNELDRAALKAFIKSEELEITVKKSMSDDDLRTAIIEATDEDEDEEPDEDEDEDEEEDGDEEKDYTSWSVTDLKKELAERELLTSGSKKVLAARLKKDDESDPF